MATFAIGDRVHAASLGTGTVKAVRNGGRYLIEIKGSSMVVDGSRLEPAARRRGARGAPGIGPAASPDDPVTAPPRSLDLHGLTALEAMDQLDAFLSEALIAGCAEARVIHGRSGGTLKAAVHARLKQLTAVRSFRIDRSNPGITLVSF